MHVNVTGLEVSGHPDGVGLHVRTPGRFAMDVAVHVLEYLDAQPGINVKKTGWQSGFGLEVAAWIPIEGENMVAELMTDGSDFEIRRVGGLRSEFEALLQSVRRFLAGAHR